MSKVLVDFEVKQQELIAALERQKRGFEALTDAQEKARTSSDKTAKQELTNSQKRQKMLREEIQDYTELAKRRDEAFSPEEIQEYNKRLNESRQRIKNLSGEYGNLKKQNSTLGKSFEYIGRQIIFAFSVDRLIRFGKEAIDLAGKTEGVQRAFDNLNNPSLLRDLRVATKGTVSDLELMQQAVRADNFKLPLNDLAKLFEFATLRANQTGESVDYLVNSITEGISKRSIRILDNLGFTTDILAEKLGNVGLTGASTAEIMEAVAKIIDEEMAKAGDQVETTAQKTARLTAEYENLKVKIGQELTPVYNDFLDVIVKTGRALTEQSEAIEQFYVPVDLLENGLSNTERTIKLLEQSLGRELSVVERATVLWKGFTDEQIKAANAQLQLNLRTQEQEDIFKKILTGPFQTAEAQAAAFAKAIEELNRQMGILTGSNKEQNNTLRAYQKQISDIRDLQLDVTNRKDYLDYQRQIEEIERKVTKITGENTKALLERISALWQLRRVTEEVLGEINKELTQFDFTESIPQEDQGLRLFGIGLDNLEMEQDMMVEGFDKATEEMKKLGINNMSDYFEYLREQARKTQEEINQIIFFGLMEVNQAFFDVQQMRADVEAEQNRRRLENLEQMELSSLERRFNNEIQGQKLSNRRKIQMEQEYADRQAQIREDYEQKRLKAEADAARKKKDLALAQAIINTALAVTEALASQNYAGAVYAAIQGGIEVAVIASTPIPEYAKGTEYLQAGPGQGKRKDDIPILANKGEAIIPTEKNKEYPGLAKAWIDGNLDEYIFKQYSMPKIKEALQEIENQKSRDFASNVASAMILNFNDKNLIKELRKGSKESIYYLQQIAENKTRSTRHV